MLFSINYIFFYYFLFSSFYTRAIVNATSGDDLKLLITRKTDSFFFKKELWRILRVTKIHRRMDRNSIFFYEIKKEEEENNESDAWMGNAQNYLVIPSNLNFFYSFESLNGFLMISFSFLCNFFFMWRKSLGMYPIDKKERLRDA